MQFSLATTERWTDKGGERQEKTEWHNCTLWGKQAETLTDYLRKGKQVYLEGRIETHEQDVDELDRAICRRSTTRSLVTLGDEAGTFGREQIAGDLHRLTSWS